MKRFKVRKQVLKNVGIVALTLAFAGAAEAATISSGVVWGGTGQTDAVCYIRNVGSAPIVVSAKIYDDTGSDVTDSSSCATVAPGSSCAAAALGLVTAHTHGCTATVTGSPKKVRGTLDIRRDASGQVTILNTDALR